MKTRRLLGLLTLLLLAVGFTGCSDDELSTIQPMSNIDDEIITFFENELPAMGTSSSFFTDVARDTEICYVVNDDKDFQHLYKGKFTPPTIDFKHSTLIIGQCQMTEGGYLVKRQFVENRGDKITLNLHIYQSLDYAPQVITPLYYWGLYPKILTNNITVNIIK